MCYCNIKLSDEQELFISKALEGNNILVDACIGSGKTTAIQILCNRMPSNLNILYLTYNRLLKKDAQKKIKSKNVTVTNYHGFAYSTLKKMGISSGVTDLISVFNKAAPPILKYDVLILDEYQDIDLELSTMLTFIKNSCPDIQIIAVGDMEQKIYDKTTLDVLDFIEIFLDNYVKIEFTKCFRLSPDIASKLGRIWNKRIVGVNDDCDIEIMSENDVIDFLAQQNPKDILCLGSRSGMMSNILNQLECIYPEKYNKHSVYASIKDTDSLSSVGPLETSAIFTTYDSSKGLERPVCVIFDFTEEYWELRANYPMQSYEILRNIFCVAASRGKSHIIFVQNDDTMDSLLSEKTLTTPFGSKSLFDSKLGVPISHMFEFKYKEDIDKCFNLIERTPVILSEDSSTLQIKNRDALIDLSPCIGIYQEAVFFRGYDIDSEIDFWERMTQNSVNEFEIDGNQLDKKILYLTSLETNQKRYNTQVVTPFVSKEESDRLKDRLYNSFTGFENVQVKCFFTFVNKDNPNYAFNAIGVADVVKDETVYELKFVSELTTEHFLQCACYMLALNLELGILWNTKTNQAYKIKIPDRKAFANCVAMTVSKGGMCNPLVIEKSISMQNTEICNKANFAVIDTETNWENEVMSVGVIIADATTFKCVDSAYYLISPCCEKSGMYSSSLYVPSVKVNRIDSRKKIIHLIRQSLAQHNVEMIMAYNASFDFNHLPELCDFTWCDILKIAAYKQYNSFIPEDADICKTGRLKRNYKVGDIYKLLSSNANYTETHNAYMDALDELKIIQLMGLNYETYSSAIINIGTPELRTIQSEFSNYEQPKHNYNCETVHSAVSRDKSIHKNREILSSDTTTQKNPFWVMSDLMERYNIGRSKITNDLFKLGIPHYKKGREYHFPIEEVHAWEINTRYYTYGKSHTRIMFPAYAEWCQYLREEFCKAKKDKNAVRINQIKELAKRHDVKLSNENLDIWITVGFSIVLLIGLMVLFR